LLLRLEQGRAKTLEAKKEKELVSEKPVSSRVEFSLAEPNVFMLDMAEWAIDDGEWNKKEESLRIHDAAKTQLGYSLEGVSGCQPWIYAGNEPKTEHILKLKYVINSEVMVTESFLALENLSATSIEFNGKEWKLMDPTFASAAGGSDIIQDYIGDGSNYTLQYVR
jgi:hypothetical protein